MRQAPLIEERRVVLSMFDRTGQWSLPYAEAGYHVITLDLEPAGGAPHPNRHHVQGNAALYEPPPFRVHGILAAPPCTYFAASGARWTRTPEQMEQALGLVSAVTRLVAVCRPAWWALENPIGTLGRWLGPPALYFDPWEYGGWLEPARDRYSKRTCLWGSFTPPEKRPVHPAEGSRMHRLPPSPTRAHLRSVTPEGFARAFFAANR